MGLIIFNLKNNLTNYLYFMIKIVFNFKCIYTYALMHVLHVFFNNNLTNYLYFYNKILFNFKYIYAFAWSYMLVLLYFTVIQAK